MSGKRLLDVAALFRASRNVALKALALRASELQNYKKTASLVRVLQSRINRVNGFDQSTSRGNTGQLQSDSSLKQYGNDAGGKAAISLAAQQEKATRGKLQSSALGQDHFYERSKDNGSADPVSNDTLQIEQKKANELPLPDGSLSTSSGVVATSNSRSSGEASNRARELQHLFERQIPAQPAKPPVSQGPDGNDQSFGVDQEQDVFSNRPRSTGPALSALPRIKLPKHAGIVQESYDSLSNSELNPDVFHSARSKEDNTQRETSTLSGANDGQDLNEETYVQLFQSHRTASKLRHSPKSAGKALAQATKAEGSLAGQDPAIHQLASDLKPDMDQDMDITSKQPQGVASTPKTQYQLRESRVPSSRIGRLWQYGGLATSMAFGAVGESFRRATGSQDSQGSLMLSANNMERLVAKLSKMRGAALKIGQMLSFQDSKTLPAPIHEVLRRVQDSADYMPASQRNKVLVDNLGSDWRELFSAFDETPIAAASIGQVHKATLASSGQEVAVKIQYPGVASSIDSDLSNLAILLTASKLLPKGLYLDKTIANARTEMAWECDYVREAEMGDRFRTLLADDETTFRVPAVFKEASGPQVLTAEFCAGTGVTKVQNFTQEEKDRIGTNILRLCLREITEFKFMQTDPNWTNFLFNAATGKLELLDFGAARDYPDEFILPYIRTLIAASRSDRDGVRELSIQLGYLTGHESQAMLNAHVDTVLTLAEPFSDAAQEVYDFRGQTITDRVRSQIPVMLRERLSPPPEETYSLHRKLSGAFLLCAKLGSRVACRDMFAKAIAKAGLT